MGRRAAATTRRALTSSKDQPSRYRLNSKRTLSQSDWIATLEMMRKLPSDDFAEGSIASRCVVIVPQTVYPSCWYSAIARFIWL